MFLILYNCFQDVAATHEPYTDSEESGSESEEITDDDDDSFDDDDMTEGSDSDVDEDFEHESSRSNSETGENKYSEKVSIYLTYILYDNGTPIDSYTTNHLKTITKACPNLF